MDRRYFLTGLGAGAIWLGGSGNRALASSWPILGAGGTVRVPEVPRPVRSCKLIGIGGAGCNFVMASSSSKLLVSSQFMPEFICIDLDGERLAQVDRANRAAPGQLPIKSMPLGTCGAGGWINGARVAALRNRDALECLLDGAEVVCLVAGLGGGTGSGVSPIVARLARAAGARTVAAVITPFAYEIRRNHNASNALGYLQHEADRVMVFSNEKWSSRYGEDVPLIEVFSDLDRHIAVSIRQWVEAISS